MPEGAVEVWPDTRLLRGELPDGMIDSLMTGLVRRAFHTILRHPSSALVASPVVFVEVLVLIDNSVLASSRPLQVLDRSLLGFLLDSKLS